MNDDDGGGPADGQYGPARRMKRLCGTGTEADMGEGLGGGGDPGRRGEPRDAVPGPRDVLDTVVLETVLAAAIRIADLDPRAEQRAVAAFRTARDTGAHRARTLRRDDWRLPGKRRGRRPVKMTFGVVFASLTLGGVAVAAIGSVGASSGGAGGDRAAARPSALAPARPGGAASSTSSGVPRPTGGPAPAQDTEAHCRAYEQVQGGHGKALDAEVRQQLVAAAGGKNEVAAYCSEQLARATAAPGRSAGTGRSGEDAADSGNGAAGRAGTSGSRASGTTGTSGGTDSTAGKSRAGGGQGGGKHK